MTGLICPISPLRINEQVARITAFLIASLVILYIVTLSPYIPLFLIADFFIRGFTSLKYSPLSWLAATISNGLKLPVVMTGKAKKIFSARVGFLFAVAMVVLFYANPLSSTIVGGVLVGFALMESLLNICVGCLVYTYVVFPWFAQKA